MQETLKSWYMKVTFMHQPFCCLWVSYDIGRASYAGSIVMQIGSCYGKCKEIFLKNIADGKACFT